MNYRFVLLIIPVAFYPFFAAHAEENKSKSQEPQLSTNIIFGRYGFSAYPKVSTAACKVEMRLNQKLFLDKFQEIQKIGLLNKSIDRSKIVTSPNLLSMGFFIPNDSGGNKVFV